MDEQSIVHSTQKFNYCFKLDCFLPFSSNSIFQRLQNKTKPQVKLTRCNSILVLKFELKKKKITCYFDNLFYFSYIAPNEISTDFQNLGHIQSLPAQTFSVILSKRNLLLKMLTSFLSRSLFEYTSINLEINNNHYKREEKLTLK